LTPPLLSPTAWLPEPRAAGAAAVTAPPTPRAVSGAPVALVLDSPFLADWRMPRSAVGVTLTGRHLLGQYAPESAPGVRASEQALAAQHGLLPIVCTGWYQIEAQFACDATIVAYRDLSDAVGVCLRAVAHSAAEPAATPTAPVAYRERVLGEHSVVLLGHGTTSSLHLSFARPLVAGDHIALWLEVSAAIRCEELVQHACAWTVRRIV
jgi:hypothetical protein